MPTSSTDNEIYVHGIEEAKIDIEANSNEDKKKIIMPINDADQELLIALADQRPSFLVYLLTFVASISGFLFGYDTGYISSALVAVGDDLGETLSYGQKELITSATSLGALIGAILGGFLSDIFGRKPAIMGSNVLFVAGSAMQTGAHTVGVMMGGRFVMGFGVGIGSLCAPLFISELAPARFRGRLVIITVLAITAGQLIAYGIGAGLTEVTHGWRILVGIGMLPPIIQFVAFYFLPDTPRFYIMKGRPEKAKEVLLKTHPGVEEALIELKIEELASIDNNISGGNPFTKTWNAIKLIHTVPSNFRALLISCGLQGIQQFSSWNSLMYFSGTIFETVGFKNATAVSIIIAGTNFVFTCIAFFVIDRVGRRNILLCSLPGMIIALVLCAIAFHFMNIDFKDNDAVIETTGISGWGVLIIVGMILFAACYAVGIGNVPWQQSELFPQEVRGVGCAYATAVNWMGSLVIAASFLTMLKNITPTGTFSFFAGLIAVALVLVFLCYPELAGLELEETQEFLTGGFNVKESVRLSKERKHKTVTIDDILDENPAKRTTGAQHVENA